MPNSAPLRVQVPRSATHDAPSTFGPAFGIISTYSHRVQTSSCARSTSLETIVSCASAAAPSHTNIRDSSRPSLFSTDGEPNCYSTEDGEPTELTPGSSTSTTTPSTAGDESLHIYYAQVIRLSRARPYARRVVSVPVSEPTPSIITDQAAPLDLSTIGPSDIAEDSSVSRAPSANSSLSSLGVNRESSDLSSIHTFATKGHRACLEPHQLQVQMIRHPIRRPGIPDFEPPTLESDPTIELCRPACIGAARGRPKIDAFGLLGLQDLPHTLSPTLPGSNKDKPRPSSRPYHVSDDQGGGVTLTEGEMTEKSDRSSPSRRSRAELVARRRSSMHLKIHPWDSIEESANSVKHREVMSFRVSRFWKIMFTASGIVFGLFVIGDLVLINVVLFSGKRLALA
ncbi:BQ2448_4738 [Microbotryum intermedium]|uniref:BQ2448_4738 protein n=1 Tax=Microbotryum intermedium TaxID=269621 RepID=A0A238FJI4_9BASI|nr:BQ2448_4738 [Microbotryum intermedium]